MSKEDLGLGNQSNLHSRNINKDGSFNVKKIGAITGVRDLYQHLVTMPWTKFLFLVIITYLSLNLLFAIAYYLIGIEYLDGLQEGNFFEEFLGCFYFSTQTFTTVGYGAVAPRGVVTNLVASLEAMVGLLSFALATGLLFGRFSKPNAKFLFSDKILLSPYREDHSGLMFRVANKRDNVLLQTTAEVILTYFETDTNGELKRGFQRLNLEISEIRLFTTTWTIVHPVDEDSPFYGFDEERFKNFRFEILIMIKSYDETFGQDVYARTSYTNDDFVYQAKFHKPYRFNREGQMEIVLEDVMGFDKTDSFKN